MKFTPIMVANETLKFELDRKKCGVNTIFIFSGEEQETQIKVSYQNCHFEVQNSKSHLQFN